MASKANRNKKRKRKERRRAAELKQAGMTTRPRSGDGLLFQPDGEVSDLEFTSCEESDEGTYCPECGAFMSFDESDCAVCGMFFGEEE